MYLNFADTVTRDDQGWRAGATSAAEAVSAIRPGDHVFVGTGCATPHSLVDALERKDLAAVRRVMVSHNEHAKATQRAGMLRIGGRL